MKKLIAAIANATLMGAPGLALAGPDAASPGESRDPRAPGGPGVCPAPTTIATLPSIRMMCFTSEIRIRVPRRYATRSASIRRTACAPLRESLKVTSALQSYDCSHSMGRSVSPPFAPGTLQHACSASCGSSDTRLKASGEGHDVG